MPRASSVSLEKYHCHGLTYLTVTWGDLTWGHEDSVECSSSEFADKFDKTRTSIQPDRAICGSLRLFKDFNQSKVYLKIQTKVYLKTTPSLQIDGKKPPHLGGFPFEVVSNEEPGGGRILDKFLKWRTRRKRPENNPNSFENKWGCFQRQGPLPRARLFILVWSWKIHVWTGIGFFELEDLGVAHTRRKLGVTDT